MTEVMDEGVPGHQWPGYRTAPDESGLSPIYGA